MAEIITKFDTKTKKFEVTKDGVAIPDIMECSFYCNEDGEGQCRLSQMTRDKEEGTMEHHALYASQDSSNEVIAKIASYLSNKPKV